MLDLISAMLPDRVRSALRRRLTPKPKSSSLSNVDQNRDIWNTYAQRWNKSKVTIENSAVTARERDSYLQCLGDEWGRLEDVERIVAEYIYPYINGASAAAEIGSGGGRVASRVAPRVSHLHCFDISKEMLRKAQAALEAHRNVDFVLLESAQLPADCTGKFDFIYSFDVFVHLDLHTMWKYFREIQRVLKRGGTAFLHTSNLMAPGGWKNFAAQDAFRILEHYFISPEIISILAQQSGLKIIKTSTPDPTNFYLNRDYLFILSKD
jgi:SAM-dependent methyltransferase